MTVLFSKRCELGLQATLFLSTQEGKKAFNAEQISSELKVPKEFVSKVLQKLCKSGIIKSKKGKDGGFLLGKQPSKIKLIDIVKAIDGVEIFSTCLLGFPGCSPNKPCPVHNKWAKVREGIIKLLSTETLADMKSATERKIKTLK
ncbi:MAG: Rrf2 family transcriptional regulator [Ignavibacteriales bacterium]|nr:Rrf2 family transcriptional regulator [Ignavibacteriales bacterium]